MTVSVGTFNTYNTSYNVLTPLSVTILALLCNSNSGFNLPRCAIQIPI